MFIRDSFMPWAVTVPLVSFGAFIWDGVFIGATATRRMLHSMAWSTALYFAVYFLLRPYLGNDALWLAFLTYLFTRSITLTIAFSRPKCWLPRQR